VDSPTRLPRRRVLVPVCGNRVTARAAWAPHVTNAQGHQGSRHRGVAGRRAGAVLGRDGGTGRARRTRSYPPHARRGQGPRRKRAGVSSSSCTGHQGQACPDAEQLALAAQAGGGGRQHHLGRARHVLQGSGWPGRTFVAYGMGTSLWSIPTARYGVSSSPCARMAADRQVRARGGVPTGQPVALHRRGQAGGPELRQPAQLHGLSARRAPGRVAVAAGRPMVRTGRWRASAKGSGHCGCLAAVP